MTVSTTQNRVSYAGNGVTLAFSFPYVFFDAADLVVLKVLSDGTFTTAVLGTDYTVTGAGADAGGTVSMMGAPAAGTTLVIYRDPQLVQPQAFVDNDPLPAKSISRGYDRLTVIAQRIRELANRSFRLSDADTSGASPIVPSPQANAFLSWNGGASALVNRTIEDVLTIAAYGTALAERLSGDGVKTDFTLSENPGGLANLDVSIGGIVQEAVRDFTWDGDKKLTFSSAPPAPSTPGDTNIYVRYQRALPQGFLDLRIAPFVQSGLGAVSRPAVAKLQDVVHVRDFGAKGDGLADDTIAIQNAINAGYVVNFGDFATHLVSAPLIVASNRQFKGNGAVLKAANQTMAAFVSANGAAVNNFSVENLRFDGQGTFGGSGATAKFSNANVGIYLNAGGTGWRVHNCKFSGMDRATTFTGGDQVTITGNHVSNNGLAGFSLANVTNFTVAHNIINGVLGDDNYPGNTYGKFGDGIYLDACVGGTVATNQITRCVRIGICLESSTAAVNKNISITGNSISDLSNSRSTEANCGIWVEGGKSDGSITITGNTVRYTSAWTGQKAYGILCFNGGVVADNYLYGPAVAGMYGFGVQAANGSTVVSDNHIQGFMAGVAVTGPRVEDAIYSIKGNTIYSNSQYGIYVFGVGSHFDIAGNVIKDNGWDLALPANGYGGPGIQLQSSGGYSPKASINNNTFISSANEGDTEGQLYGVLLANGGGGLPTLYSLKSNAFIFNGVFVTPYPNHNIRPACYGQDSGGGSVTTIRDIIGDHYGNTCTKASMQQGAIINSFSGSPRYMGLISSIPSTALPTTPALIGDYYENASLAAGGPEGWICTGSGTPGTWSPYGILGAAQCSRVNPTSGATLTQLETNVNALLTALQSSKLMF